MIEKWATRESNSEITGYKPAALTIELVARGYASYLNRWPQPDTIIPQPDNPQSLNRYAYVLNNPVRYNDPTGHDCQDYDAEGHIITICAPDQEVPNPSGTLTAVPGTLYHQSVDIWDKVNTHTSQAGIDFIKHNEVIGGVNPPLVPYNDPSRNQYCTVGYGHLLDPLNPAPCTPAQLNTTYTQDQIDAFFAADLNQAESSVRGVFQAWDKYYRPDEVGGSAIPINQTQFDALVDFTYQMGSGSLEQLINNTQNGFSGSEAGTLNLQPLSDQMLGIYSQGGGPGTLIRRKADLNLFISGIYP